MQVSDPDTSSLHTGVTARRRARQLFRSARHRVYERAVAAAIHVPSARTVLVERFASDLRDLNDALTEAGLVNSYRVFAGLLLGWAREGGIMPHDILDADIAITDKDFHLMAKAVPILLAAGFKCQRRFVNNDGVLTQIVFTRHGADFDVFRMFPDADRFRYYLYDPTTQFTAYIPVQDTVPFTLVGRTWFKSLDHALELKSIYGSWEIPDPSFSYRECLSIESSCPARYRQYEWRGGLAALAFDESMRVISD